MTGGKPMKAKLILILLFPIVYFTWLMCGRDDYNYEQFLNDQINEHTTNNN